MKKVEEDREDKKKKLRDLDLAGPIFSSSAVMLGLCLTIISVIRGQNSAYHLSTIVDDIIAVDALLFLAACFLSYAVLRSRKVERRHRLESLADLVFLLGMTGMAVASGMFVWTIL